MQLNVIRFASRAGFSMTEQAVRAVGRGEVFRDISTVQELDRAERALLPIPSGGLWNFRDGADGSLGDGYLMLDAALSDLGGRRDFNVCLDCGGEGFQFDLATHDLFAARLAERDLSQERTFLLTSRLNPEAHYISWCQAHDRAPVVTPVYSPVQLYFVVGQHRSFIDYDFLRGLVSRRSPDFGAVRPKKYLCLNYSPRESRWATVLSLMSRGLLSDGLVSFHGLSVDNGPLEPGRGLDVVLKQLRALGVPDDVVELAPVLDRLSPITLPEPDSSRFDKAYAPDMPSWYRETYFSIVTESDFHGWAGDRLTEKVLKPLLNLHPFVVIGTPGVLAELRRLGFQTFSPLIDESYDEIRDPKERLRRALSVAVTLAEMSLPDLHRLYTELWPRLTHNLLHLLGGASGLVDRDPAFTALRADV